MSRAIQGPRLLTSYEVARLFGVGAKTVTQWARDGKVTSIRTPGGNHRFYADEIEQLLDAGRTERTR